MSIMITGGTGFLGLSQCPWPPTLDGTCGHPDIGGQSQVLAAGGASGDTVRGSTTPFPATREERERSGNPRHSIGERYPSKGDYLERVRRAGQALVDAGEQ